MTIAQPPAGAEVATLGGGCFWCIEAVFDSLKGVSSVESGYTGGNTVNPTYQQICNGDTGHAEVVRMTFDPAVISFHEILAVFFAIHDPTTLNRQGNDVARNIGPRFSITRPPKKRPPKNSLPG
jgi:peptide-methionine (S)-S-oxide reductase